MDLPTCPACGQSVLDDDVDDCPFCGASLKTGKASGKPAAKPAARPVAKAAAKVPPRSAPDQPAKSAAPPAPARRGPLDSDDEVPTRSDEDPFEVDSATADKAIRLRPAAVKGASVRIVCPMCETAGYASSKAAGQPVRCANPKCIVPIFTAPVPKIEKPVEAPPPRPRRFSAVTILMTLLVLVVVGGVGAAWQLGLLTGSGQKRPGTISDDIRSLIAEGDSTNNVPNDGPPDPGNGGDENPAPPPPQSVSIDELAREAPDRMIDLARLEQPERGKAASRRMIAEAYAQLNELAEARQQVEQLAKVGVNMPFYRIPPVVAIGWRESEAGRKEAANAAATEALDLARQLPDFGRDPMEIALGLAAFLAATGQADAAESLVRSRDGEASYARLAGPLLHARATRTYDLEAALNAGPPLPSSAPAWAAVAQLLADRGQWPQAVAWSRRAPTLEGQTECLAAVAAHAAIPDATLAAILADAPPASRARLAARAAIRLAAAGKKAEAEASVAAAKSALAEVGNPSAFSLPGLKETADATPPDPSPPRIAAQAAAEIAHAEASLGKQAEALASLDAAFAFARGIGPPPLEVRARVEAANRTPDAVRSQLRSQLKLSTNDEVRLAFNAYRTQLDQLLAAGDRRLDVQGRLVAGLIPTPLAGELWSVVQKSQSTPDPLLQTVAPWELLLALKASGDAKAVEIEQALAAASRAAAPEHALRLAVSSHVAAGKLDQAAAEIDKSSVGLEIKSRTALVACNRLVRAGKTPAAFLLIKGMRRESILREEAYELTAAHAARLDQGRTVWAAADAKGLLPSEKVAIYRGFVAGTAK